MVRAASVQTEYSMRSAGLLPAPLTLPPEGLRPIWLVASLLVGHSPASGDAPSSRLATGQIGRNERHRIYAHDHLASKPKESYFHEPTIVHQNYGGWRGGNGFCPVRLGRAETQSAQSDYVFHNRCEGLGAREVPRHERSGI